MNSAFYSFLLTFVLFIYSANAHAAKHGSVFYSPEVMAKIQATVADSDWGRGVRDQAVKTAAPWLAMSDETLWNLMFSNSITRSWMVWSNGVCPSCKRSVTMYNWKIAAVDKPWKVQCPHCNELFPKNDFSAYYCSGLDEHGLFDPQKADHSLLFNAEHPKANDPLHTFGVDDGEGYVEGQNRWRFIGAYLVYGQWKQIILPGIRNLAAAYVLTRDQAYAHKAAILLDRVADVYPTFDFSTQALSYERRDPIIGQGYVSVWHDGCEETREMALAYDMIFDGLQNDFDLIAFLSQKVEQFNFDNSKRSLADIRSNIEKGILQDALLNRFKIESNFPRTDAAVAVIETVLGWPENRQRIMAIIDKFIEKSTLADGLSGEKGLAGYSSGLSRSLAQFLSLYSRLDRRFLADLMRRHPALAKTFRFHIDTWFDEQYYPNIGDTGVFGAKVNRYVGATFIKNPVPVDLSTYAFTSSYSLFWQLYEITGDPDYVKILYKENDNSTAGLPYDFLAGDAKAFQHQVWKVIDKNGNTLVTPSFNKETWCLAMFHSGSDTNRRALWIDYDIGGNHCHSDAMNIGLLAKGLDILPGFGYPPVQFGGWYSAKALWYRKTAGHNTVVVDGKDQMPDIGTRETAPLATQLNPLKAHEAGKTTCWMPGRNVQGIRVSGAGLYHGANLQQYERTVALIDVSAADSYVLDIFRVVGGTDHAKFTHGYFGDLQTVGLTLIPAPDFGYDTQMSQFRNDAAPPLDWQAVWRVNDHNHYLPKGADVRLNYFDVTRNAEAAVAKTWIAFGFNSDQTTGIPSLLVRRKNNAGPLSSCFVDILEPCNHKSQISSVQRLDVLSSEKVAYSDMNIAVGVQFENGETDLIVAMDIENPLLQKPSFKVNKVALAPQWKLKTDAEFALIRLDAGGRIKKIALAHGSYLHIGDLDLQIAARSEYVELNLENKSAMVLTGNAGLIKKIQQGSNRLQVMNSK